MTDAWSRELAQSGAVELTAGREVLVRVGLDGVRLPSRDLLVPWVHLGFADGVAASRFPRSSGSFTLFVSRTWWASHVAASAGDERRRAERDLADDWGRPTVSFGPRHRVPVVEFGEWLSAEAVVRAPLPDRFLLTPSAETSVLDRDSNRPVPLDRLGVSPALRDRLAAWGAAADAVPVEERTSAAAWERFLPEGHDLAARLQEESGRPAAVWKDCPEAP